MHYVKINGKDYRIALSWRAFKMHTDARGITQLGNIGEAFQNITTDELLPLLWNCLEAGARIEGRELDITREDLDNVDVATVLAFFGTVPAMFGVNEDNAKDAKKKRLI